MKVMLPIYQYKFVYTQTHSEQDFSERVLFSEQSTLSITNQQYCSGAKKKEVPRY